MSVTKELSAVTNGSLFEVAGIEFIKLDQVDNRVLAVTKNSTCNSVFGKNADFGSSDIKTNLEKEWIPKIEAAVGSENLLEFETDLTALDGTKPYKNVVSKACLVNLDVYRKYREIFGTYPDNSWWWLATPESEEFTHLVLCVSPSGLIYCNCSVCITNGVRPFCIFESSILVSCHE